MAMGVEDEPHRSSWNNKSLLKVIRIISSDPSVFFFLISLTLLLMCCPLLALYITTAKDVPDFDTVKVNFLLSFNLPVAQIRILLYENNKVLFIELPKRKNCN